MSDQKIVQPRSGNAIVDLDIRLSSALYRDLGLKVPRPVFKLLENTGSGLLWLPLAPALLLAPSAPPALHTCAANLLLGLLVDIAFVGTLKGVFRRPRPSYNDAGDFLLVVAVDSYSFPSGHAARASFLALYALIWLSGSHLPLAIAATVLGLTIALSRCLMGRHYLGDVVAGLLLGIATTAVVTQGTFSAEGCWISAAQSEAARQWVSSHWSTVFT